MISSNYDEKIEECDFDIYCDYCSGSDNYTGTDRHDCMAQAKEEGRKALNVRGVWTHRCRACNEGIL